MLLPPSVPASPSPPSLCSQEASPIFCLIAAVSWQKATIFALLLSENKLQIIYSFTHTHTHILLHTHSVSALQSRQQKLIVFLFSVACFASSPGTPTSKWAWQTAQRQIPAQLSATQHWQCLLLCLPCLPALLIWAKSHFDQNSERWHHLHFLQFAFWLCFLSLPLSFPLSLTLYSSVCFYFSFYLLF